MTGPIWVKVTVFEGSVPLAQRQSTDLDHLTPGALVAATGKLALDLVDEALGNLSD